MKRREKFLIVIVGLWVLTVTVRSQPLGWMEMVLLFWLIFVYWGVPTYLEGWERRRGMWIHMLVDQLYHGPNYEEARDKLRRELR